MVPKIMAMITPTAITGIDQMADQSHSEAAQAKLIAVVLVLAMGLWLLVLSAGDQYGWPPKFILLADLSAGAAFLWTMVATYRLWRKRRA